MPNEPLVSRWKEKRNSTLWIILICGPVGAAIGFARGWEKFGWRGLWLVLPLLAVYGGLAWWIVRMRAKARRQSIVIDPTRETIAFHFFSFVTGFWPEKARTVEEIRFADVLACTYTPPHRSAPGHLLVRTTKGRVTIPETMEHFETIHPLLEEMAETNATRPTEHSRHLALEPRIATPWYGWLLLFIPVGAILWFCWKVFNAP